MINCKDSPGPDPAQATRLDAHVALLTAYIPPYMLPVYQQLARTVRKLTVLISTPMEKKRHWQPRWGSLDVRVQRTLTIPRRWKHPAGFSDALEVHVPWDTTAQLKSIRPDVVVSQQMGMRSLLAAIHCGRRHGPPLVLITNMSEHSEQGRGWLRPMLRKWFTRHADCIAVNGDSGTRYLRQLGVAPEDIVIVPYTPDPSSLHEGPTTRDDSCGHHLLYVGQLVERKGMVPFMNTLVGWAGRRPDREVRFTIVGSGPLRKQLEAVSRPSNLRLEMLGEQDYQRVRESYGQAGIFVFPSLSDEWGLVVNEAMYAGLPVLGCTYSQAVSELCTDQETGWTFRTDVPSEIEHALNRAFGCSVDQLNSMRPAARERVAGITPALAADQLVKAIQLAQRNKYRKVNEQTGADNGKHRRRSADAHASCSNRSAL